MALPTVLDAVERLGAFARVANALPSAGERVAVAGLEGSSDAVLVAALARRFPQRFFVVVTDAVADAERWLADLHALGGDEAAALYPPREGFGEVEPHAEIAGERVETLERVSRGAVRVLLTTARALLERTALPLTLGAARLELRKGDVRRPEELAAHLESIGFERVTMVDDVAQFAVRGGIFDIYSFGMAEPVRLEFWGDDITELRHFELGSQRSTREASVAVILPVDGAPGDVTLGTERVSVVELFPPDTVLVLPDESHIAPELARTWDEAEHHVDVVRRRGESTIAREDLFLTPEQTARSLGRFGRIAATDPARERECIVFPIKPPESIARDIKLLRTVVRDGTPTMILCDNPGQAERLEELLNEDPRYPAPASLVIGVLNAGFVVPPGVGQRRETGDGGREGAAARRGRDRGIVRIEPPSPVPRPQFKVFAFSRTTKSSAVNAASGAPENTPPAPPSRRSPRSSPGTTSCTSNTASASIVASCSCSCAKARSRSRSSSMKGATGSTSRCIALTRSSGTARGSMSATMPHRPGCTSLAGDAGPSNARRRAPRSRR